MEFLWFFCRCVDEEDKSFAIGLAYLFVSLFAFIPSPIVYGAIIGQYLLWSVHFSSLGADFELHLSALRNILEFLKNFWGILCTSKFNFMLGNNFQNEYCSRRNFWKVALLLDLWCSLGADFELNFSAFRIVLEFFLIFWGIPCTSKFNIMLGNNFQNEYCSRRNFSKWRFYLT